MVRLFQGEVRKIQYFVVIDPFYRHYIDFDGIESYPLRFVKALPYLSVTVPSGNPEESLRSEGIQTDIDATDTAAPDIGCEILEKDPVGCQGNFSQSFYPAESLEKMDESLSYQGLSAGEPDLPNSLPDTEPDKAEHFFICEDLPVRHEFKPFFRHAIDASQVAAVRDRKAEIADDSVISVLQ